VQQTPVGILGIGLSYVALGSQSYNGWVVYSRSCSTRFCFVSLVHIFLFNGTWSGVIRPSSGLNTVANYWVHNLWHNLWQIYSYSVIVLFPTGHNLGVRYEACNPERTEIGAQICDVQALILVWPRKDWTTRRNFVTTLDNIFVTFIFPVNEPPPVHPPPRASPPIHSTHRPSSPEELRALLLYSASLGPKPLSSDVGNWVVVLQFCH
jgi:hypothetical protein